MGRSKHQPGMRQTGFERTVPLARRSYLPRHSCRPDPGAPSRKGAVRSVHGDWQIRCDTPPGAQGEQCALIQSVVAEDRSNAGLTVIVLKTADQKSKLMRVVAPLGVLLPSGLGLKLDNQDVGRAGFVRCLPNGCVAEVVMDDKLLGQLRHRQDRDLHYLRDARKRASAFRSALAGWRRGMTSCREGGPSSFFGVGILRRLRPASSRTKRRSSFPSGVAAGCWRRRARSVIARRLSADHRHGIELPRAARVRPSWAPGRRREACRQGKFIAGCRGHAACRSRPAAVCSPPGAIQIADSGRRPSSRRC